MSIASTSMARSPSSLTSQRLEESGTKLSKAIDDLLEKFPDIDISRKTLEKRIEETNFKEKNQCKILNFISEFKIQRLHFSYPCCIRKFKEITEEEIPDIINKLSQFFIYLSASRFFSYDLYELLEFINSSKNWKNSFDQLKLVITFIGCDPTTLANDLNTIAEVLGEIHTLEQSDAEALANMLNRPLSQLILPSSNIFAGFAVFLRGFNRSVKFTKVNPIQLLKYFETLVINDTLSYNTLFGLNYFLYLKNEKGIQFVSQYFKDYRDPDQQTINHFFTAYYAVQKVTEGKLLKVLCHKLFVMKKEDFSSVKDYHILVQNIKRSYESGNDISTEVALHILDSLDSDQILEFKHFEFMTNCCYAYGSSHEKNDEILNLDFSEKTFEGRIVAILNVLFPRRGITDLSSETIVKLYNNADPPLLPSSVKELPEDCIPDFFFHAEWLSLYIKNKEQVDEILSLSLDNSHDDEKQAQINKIVAAIYFGSIKHPKNLNPEQRSFYLDLMIKHPNISKKILEAQAGVENITLADGGGIQERFTAFSRTFFRDMDLEKIIDRTSPFLQDYKSEVLDHLNDEPIVVEGANIISILEKKSYIFERWQGRTQIFKHQTGGTYLALKWLKKNEDLSLFNRELRTLIFLTRKKDELGLKSALPIPHGIYQNGISLPNQHKRNIDDGIETNQEVAYMYTCLDDSYFQYVHDKELSEEEFMDACERAYHDLFVLAKHGLVWTALADLFHTLTENRSNRDDSGVYIPLVGLLRYGSSISGPGRINGFRKAVEYLNIRRSGIADFGDSGTIFEATSVDHPRIKVSHKNLFYKSGKALFTNLKTLLFANYLAEYLLVFELALGYRKSKRSELNIENPGHSENITNMVLRIAHIATQAFTNLGKIDSEALVETACQSYDHLGRENCYWMNAANYSDDIQRNQIRKDIYLDQIIVRVDATRGRNSFIPEIGYSVDRENLDLGPLNGPDPRPMSAQYHHLLPMFLLKDSES
ncbi:MAG: hypothetical protein KR126chlam1_00552 [Chlamydiae bacterium]|nr:hypothetical protein [Chlamydiota bacterium]